MSGAGGSGNGKSPSKKETVYSDRFVPSRAGSTGLQGFNLLDHGEPPPSTSNQSNNDREVRYGPRDAPQMLYSPCE